MNSSIIFMDINVLTYPMDIIVVYYNIYRISKYLYVCQGCRTALSNSILKFDSYLSLLAAVVIMAWMDGV
jgi:hypothetical protein